MHSEIEGVREGKDLASEAADETTALSGVLAQKTY
jgi:hypothetical protein